MILSDGRNTLQVHPPSDPAGYDTLFVVVEVVSSLFTDQQVKGLQFGWIYNLVGDLGYNVRPKELYYLPGDIRRRKHTVHLPCLDRRLRQLGELGGGRVLDKNSASLGPDCLNSADTIGTGAGKDDRNGTFGRVLGK